MDNQGHPVVEAFDTSFSAMQAIAELLKPDVPYMYNGQPMFNTPAQFITTGATYPVSLKFVSQPGGGVGNWSASVQQVLLPQMNFNYLEKDQNGNYKYVDNIVEERKPLLLSNPNFYEQVLNSVSQAYQQQMQAGATNPYENDMPFPDNDAQASLGQTDVVAGMTGESMNNFSHSNSQATQPTAPAPANAPMNNASNSLSQAPQGSVSGPQPTTPAPSQNGSQAPQTPNSNNSNSMDQALDFNQDVNNFINSLNKQ